MVSERNSLTIGALFALIVTPQLLSALNSHSERPLVVDRGACSPKETCHACIQTPGCMWCSKPENKSHSSAPSIVRCQAYEGEDPLEHGNGGMSDPHKKEWCPPQYIYRPTSSMKYIENKELRNAARGVQNDTDAIQLRPQKVELKLRVGEPFPLQLQYSQAADYPVDLYFLMDLSASMDDDKEKLSTLGDLLAQEMNNLTSNFRLGFGSFVDKVTLPYVSTHPTKIKSPCTINGRPCAPPYGFINNMPLTLDTSLFKDEVQKAKVSGNLDSPEGGLDALMQVMVCRNEIKWRMKARHLIILATDAEFHSAGDGKLAGIVEPNDCHCHLNDRNEYTHGLEMDYPTISQVNRIAQENNMNIIFAVTEKKEKVYIPLTHRINGASCGVLNKDSSNVVTLVRDQYAKIVDSVALTDNAESYIRVQYFSSCLNHSSEERETRECGGIRKGDFINFTAYITVVKCPEKAEDRKLKFHIKPLSLNESVEVNLEILCDCPCEKPGNPGYEEHSDSCSNHGSLKCGVCDCNDDYLGNECQCQKGVIAGENPDNITGCISEGDPNDPKAVICSNLGSCECGVCVCNTKPDPKEIISGKYCECDNFSCNRDEGKVCSGPDHGTCICGVCVCNNGWAGEICEYRNSTDTCINPGATGIEAQICSGQGECKHGNCICNSKYSGLYCEHCPTCKGGCEALQNCVECLAFGTSSNTVLDEKECLKCNFSVIKVDSLRKENSKNGTADDNQDMGFLNGEDDDEDSAGYSTLCGAPDNAGCSFYFDFRYKDRKLIVRVQKEKECGSSEELLGIVLGVVGSIVLAGIVLLLVWKLLTTLHDQREYVRFEKERQNAKWDQGINPLYHEPTTNFQNPIFGK